VFITTDRSAGARPAGYMTRLFALALLLECLFVSGCATQAVPPRASFTQTDFFDRPPKPDDCLMPVLNTEPLTPHRRIAMVEAWGAVDQQDQTLAALKSKGCETGADALVLVEGQSQVDPRIAKFGLPEALVSEEEKMDTTQGQRHKNDLAPPIGQAGHPGYYVDSIAIVYEKVKANPEPPGR
jgi:hypothetical protein